MAVLSMTFWPNPVVRNHTGEMRWYFNIGLRVDSSSTVNLYRYHGAWYDMMGHIQDTKAAPLDIKLEPRRPVSYPDLWVTSGLSEFRYRLTVFGRDANGRELQTEAVLVCQ